jgi:hypothetical protein
MGTIEWHGPFAAEVLLPSGARLYVVPGRAYELAISEIEGLDTSDGSWWTRIS